MYEHIACPDVTSCFRFLRFCFSPAYLIYVEILAYAVYKKNFESVENGIASIYLAKLEKGLLGLRSIFG